MSEIIKVFHGSGQPVIKPDLAYCSKYSDSGRGFYVTQNRKQAIEWGAKRTKDSTFAVSCFEFTLDKELTVKTFSEPDNEWLDFVIQGRNGGALPYDIIIGPVADDTVRRALEVFNNICLPAPGQTLTEKDTEFAKTYKTKIIEMLKVKKDYSQVALLNNKALDYLQYKSFDIYDSKTREALSKKNNYRTKAKTRYGHDF